MDNYLDLSLFKISSLGTNVEASPEDLKIDYTFTWIGWFFVTIFGTTQTPTSITFTCIKSNETFEKLQDKKTIAYYMLLAKR